MLARQRPCLIPSPCYNPDTNVAFILVLNTHNQKKQKHPSIFYFVCRLLQDYLASLYVDGDHEE